jgi:hypothetical protein
MAGAMEVNPFASVVLAVGLTLTVVMFFVVRTRR